MPGPRLSGVVLMRNRDGRVSDLARRTLNDVRVEKNLEKKKKKEKRNVQKCGFMTRLFMTGSKNVRLKPTRQRAGPSRGTVDRLAGTSQGFFKFDPF